MKLIGKRVVSEPLVSVMVVTYNQENYVQECLDSIVNQDYKNIEIIVSDDGSVDKTPEILKSYEKNHQGKIRVILSDKNEGITLNCNKALAECKGDYIALMGGDDYMYQKKLSTQIKYMQDNNNCFISYHDLSVFDSESRNVLYNFNERNGFVVGKQRDLIRSGAVCGGSSVVIRADAIPETGFDTRLPVASDWLFFIETLGGEGEIGYINSILGAYRRHSSNVTVVTKKISQNDLDHLFSLSILMQKTPGNFDVINYRYAMNLVGLRHKLPYFKAMLTSFMVSPNRKAFIGIMAKIMSFGKVEL